MLTSDQFDALVGPITDLYREFEQTILEDIARRLSKMDMTATAAWQTQRLSESGMIYEDILKRLSILTGRSEQELTTLFKRAGVQSMKFDDSIYKAAGLDPLPLNLSPAMAQVLAAGLRKTGGVINNLTMTTALSGQQSFIHAADLAYLQVSSGAMSYDQAIRQAVKIVGDSGLPVTYPTGHVDKLDVAMRRTVLTGVGQTTGELQMTRAQEMGQDLVETSAHIGARPSHALWQGKIFSRSGTDPKNPSFVAETGYGTGAGLGGWNCRHSFYPFFAGISKNAYDQATRDAFANKTVTYQGKEISAYDASQIQRKYERAIRYWKRQAGMLESASLDATAELQKIRDYQARLRSFVKQTGMRRQSVREQI
jgi:hypothetical protein